MCGCLLYDSYWGPGPGMCPDREWNRDPLVHRLAVNPLRHTSQGYNKFLIAERESLLVSLGEGF